MPHRNMRPLFAIALSVGALAVAVSAQASTDEPSCTLTEAEFATALRTLTDWQAISEFHHKHAARCPDDGWYAEGYSDLIVRTLATQWTRTPDLARMAKRSPGFLAFVLKHIDASADTDQLKLIEQRATTRCPTGQSALCKSLRAAAQAALAELEPAGRARPAQP